MAYVKTDWKNREVEKPRTYTMVDNGDGTITLTPAEGTVFETGTPINAETMNKIESAVEANDTALGNKVNRDGDTLTGTLTGTTMNATVALQEGGTNLSTKYQAKGNYQASGNYVKYEADINGVRLITGYYGGNGKPIVLYLTSAQPGASASEHRVWIQIDNF